MKKFAKVLGMTILGVSVLTACGAEEATMSSAEDGSEAQDQTQTEDQSQTEKQNADTEEAAEAAVEIKAETFGTWKDSIGNIYGSYSAVITNTGEQPAAIGNIQINFEGKDGAIIGTLPMVLAVPDIIMPGEVAYIGENTILDTATSPDQVTGVSTNIDFSSTEEKPVMLKTQNVKLTEGKNEYANAYTVTGTVVNSTDQKADDIRLAAALYDAKGKFLGTLSGSIQVSLNPDGKAGFELNYPELPKEIKGKATEVKVKAYNWTF